MSGWTGPWADLDNCRIHMGLPPLATDWTSIMDAAKRIEDAAEGRGVMSEPVTCGQCKYSQERQPPAREGAPSLIECTNEYSIYRMVTTDTHEQGDHVLFQSDYGCIFGESRQ